MADLADVVLAHDVKHAYADDIQLYFQCHVHSCSDLKITDVQRWMEANRLKLNANKTELPWAGSKYDLALLGSSGLSLDLGQ